MALHTGLDEVRAPAPVHFSIGGILGSSLWIVVWNFPGFVVMAVAASIPMLVLAVVVWLAMPGQIFTFSTENGIAFSIRNGVGQNSPGESAVYLLFVLLALLAVLTVQAAVTYRTFESLRGSKAGIGACILRGVTALARLLGSGIVLLIVFGVVGGAAFYLAFSLFALTLGIGVTAIACTIFAIPFLFLWIAWWVFLPAQVMERAGPFACFARSWSLTKRRRWGILALLLLVYLVEFGLEYVLMLALPSQSIIGAILGSIIGLFFFFLGTAMATAGYYHLRGEKEGIAAVARVFD